MSESSLWIMDKDYKGSEVSEFRNSWLFSPIVWGVLLDKYMAKEIQTPYGYKKSFMSDSSLFPILNKKINECHCIADRICWEISNQQVFSVKDKDLVSNEIREFVTLNSNYDKNTDGIYPLKQEHIIDRFNEIANDISALDEDKNLFFIFKNTNCDDNVQYWFSKYDEENDDYIERPLSEVEKPVTEFVVIENGKIVKFISNLDYFK